MAQISSRWTGFRKWGIPAIWFGILAVAVIVLYFAHLPLMNAFSFLPFLLLAVFWFYAFRRVLWNLADEVVDEGACLLIRRGKLQERIFFADIDDVSVHRFIHPRRITLHLCKPGNFGYEVAFVPKLGCRALNPFARDTIADRLTQQVDRARNPSGTS